MKFPLGIDAKFGWLLVLHLLNIRALSRQNTEYYSHVFNNWFRYFEY